MSPANLPSARSILWLEMPALLRGSGFDSTIAPEDVVLLDAFTVYDEQSNASNTTAPYAKSQEDFLGQQQSVSPETHVAYALTWFSLAAAGLFMTYRRFRPPAKRKRGRPPSASAAGQ